MRFTPNLANDTNIVKTVKFRTHIDIFRNRAAEYLVANQRFENARISERNELINLACFDLSNSDKTYRICDLQAAGAYLSSGCEKIIGPNRSNITCVEPSAKLAIGIPKHFKKIISPLENIPLPDESFDRVMTLAGFHHCPNLTLVLSEAHRLLTQKGYFAIAEVEEDTGTAKFLNEFVDKHTIDGHKGFFINEKTLNHNFHQLNMKIEANYLAQVPWNFINEKEMLLFCQEIFGLSKASLNQIKKGISDYLGVQKTDHGIQMNWSLRYALAQKL